MCLFVSLQTCTRTAPTTKSSSSSARVSPPKPKSVLVPLYSPNSLDLLCMIATQDGYGAHFPKAISISDSAKDLITKLLNKDTAVCLRLPPLPQLKSHLFSSSL